MAENFTTFMCRLSRNSWILNLLETLGTVQTCSWIALPLPLPVTKTKFNPCHDKSYFSNVILLCISIVGPHLSKKCN
jgi:hypothetical protein